MLNTSNNISRDFLIIHGARTHNLKNISVTLPKNRLIAITGPSGSGKSSLIYDSIFVEAQRRFIDSLSTFAKQIVGKLTPPDVDSMENLPPAIALSQGNVHFTARSTVGTYSEIYDYLRLLYSKIGHPHSPLTGEELFARSFNENLQTILDEYQGEQIHLYAYIPVPENQDHLFSQLLSLGFLKVLYKGRLTLIEDIQDKKIGEKRLSVLIDRYTVKNEGIPRIKESLEHALRLGDGVALITSDRATSFLSEKYFCKEGQALYSTLSPKEFSFNSPLGACKKCLGLGQIEEFKLSSLKTDERLPFLEGAYAFTVTQKDFLKSAKSYLEKCGTPVELPFQELGSELQLTLLKGSHEFIGLLPYLESNVKSKLSKQQREEYLHLATCSECHGERLNLFSRLVTVENITLPSLVQKTVHEVEEFLHTLKRTPKELSLTSKLTDHLLYKIRFLKEIGLSHLTLDRMCESLSLGEAQRLKLATQLGNSLSGILYILDEPSKGLHPHDQKLLIPLIKRLVDQGNTVLMIDHSKEMIRCADYIIEFGPGAGSDGGEIIFEGTLTELLSATTATANYLNSPTLFKNIIEGEKLKSLQFTNINKRFFKNENLTIPLHSLVAITGVSGSGKSTLVSDIIIPAVKASLSRRSIQKIEGVELVSGTSMIQSICVIDESFIGKSGSSNPATYLGIFDEIRELFSKTKESLSRGYDDTRFSFNAKGGRCESCQGQGQIKIEMHFLPDVFIECDECLGKRYNTETLGVYYREKTIADILNLSIKDAKEFFKNHKNLYRSLQLADDLGLSYLKLGQPSNTLSGGESQRLKLTKELSKKLKGHTLYILDEPSSGLFYHEIKKLREIFQQLIDDGNSVIIIEHHLDLIAFADHVVDLGPLSGSLGGKIIASTSPKELSQISSSLTGNALKTSL